MPRALKICPTPGCPNVVQAGRCDTCSAMAERQRGSATERGYGHAHRTQFRAAVLRRDPLCTCVDDSHGHTGQCLAPSTVADHHPRSRRELVALGLNPNDPQYGRGICTPCHNKHTATAQPGGWHQGDAT